MLVTKLNRLFTEEEIRTLNPLPDDFHRTVMNELVPVSLPNDRTPRYLESDLEKAVERVGKQFQKKTAATTQHRGQRTSKSRRPPGRPNTTRDLAEYFDELHKQGKTDKEIYRMTKQRFPNRVDVRNPDQLRSAWKRHFRK